MQIKNPHIQQLKLTSPVILAPMAGITALPYRRIMKRFGAGLVHTEMISANGLIREGEKTRLLLTSHPEEQPLAIQLFGAEPTVLAQAAGMVADSADLLDINMGCPVKKVVRSGAGSALLSEPLRIAAILSAIRRVYPGPLTIKIRSGWDDGSINYLKIGKIAENEGVDAVTLHPRTRSQGFSGRADWRHIAELKATLNIPVFGSGDIFAAEDALKLLDRTACDAVMIGRGGYGNPWLISRILALLAGAKTGPPTAAEIYRIAMEHLELHLEQFGGVKTLLEMRKHLCWYARGRPGAGDFRAALQQVRDITEAGDLCKEFFLRNQAA